MNTSGQTDLIPGDGNPVQPSETDKSLTEDDIMKECREEDRGLSSLPHYN